MKIHFRIDSLFKSILNKKNRLLRRSVLLLFNCNSIQYRVIDGKTQVSIEDIDLDIYQLLE